MKFIQKIKFDKSIKNKIFRFNNFMVISILIIFFIINIIFVKLYINNITEEIKIYSEENIKINKNIDEEELEEIVENLTVHRGDFLILFLIDGIICILLLFVVSQGFTRKLTSEIIKPINLLSNGSKRIKENILDESINYDGIYEFENICEAFNEMQKHLSDEKLKNEKYEKMRIDMVSGISHDLKTPLTAVKGIVSAFSDGMVKEENKTIFLNIASKRIDEIEKLLNQLLYFSKLEMDKLEFNFTSMYINRFLEEYIAEKINILKSEKIKIEFKNNSNSDLKVCLDEIQLKRIFDNLLENSIKYSEKENLEINIISEKIDDQVCLKFCDNGNGIDDEKIAYIFNEFYRGDESRNKKEGNGLGLYIVKTLVETMKGSVFAENMDGLCITIKFPIIK